MTLQAGPDPCLCFVLYRKIWNKSRTKCADGSRVGSWPPAFASVGRLSGPPIDGIEPRRYRTSRWRVVAHTGVLAPYRVDGGKVKRSILTACLISSVAALGACSSSVDCSGGNYRGGCYPGTALPAAASPAVASPVVARPAVASPAVANPGTGPGAGAANVGRGEPSDFAAVDDRQCRSYGLTFGTRDYADCRIRLSAQHRGLDPNLGTTAPGQGSR